MLTRIAGGLACVLIMAACAGPNVTPTGPIDGPVYYVTDGVVMALYGDQADDARQQIACETRAPIGSNIERTYCYTAEEVVLRHLADKQETERLNSYCLENLELCLDSDTLR